MDLIALKFIGVGLLSIAMAAAALSMGKIFSSFFDAVSRNPSAADKISKYIYVAAALTEAIAIFSVLLALIILIK